MIFVLRVMPPNQIALQPTPHGALRSAFAGHVIGPAWLSSIVRGKNRER
jgi:hypothetical protein